jgi:hypothetical protein
MQFDELYPSKFLRASDLAGGPLPVTIGGVTRENIGGEQKVIMTFATGEKALILNKTNGRAVSKLFGTNTANWIGKTITLVPTMVDFKGESVEGIRVRTTPAPKAGAARVATPPPEPPFNDEIGV